MSSQPPTARTSISADTPSFPNPVDMASNHRPSSGVSSHMTDVACADGDAQSDHTATDRRQSQSQAQTQPAQVTVPGMTGPVGEPGLPPSRPSSAATSRGGWSQSGPSRRNQATGSYAGSTGAASTRPPTSHSRTHVPSLTAQAFFRPMSSQRLQAQRSQRPRSLLAQTPVVGVSDGGDGNEAHNRQSSASAVNQQRGGVLTGASTPLGLQHDHHHHHHQFPSSMRPMSRGTDITDVPDVPELPDRTTANTSPNGADTLRSKGESEAPLREDNAGGDSSTAAGGGQSGHKPNRLDLSKLKTGNSPNLGGTGGVSGAQKSPRSFRSSLLPNRNSRGGQSRTSVQMAMRPSGHAGGHEKLPSTASSPKVSAAQKDAVRKEMGRLGKNYEYFTGNTVFCMGGRWQNTRDRPINIATGVFIVLPAVLFYVFSAKWLWFNLSPAIPITFTYLFVICISSFWHASVTDPGVLPRNLHPFPPVPQNEDPLTLGPPMTAWTMVLSPATPSTAMEVPVKFCRTCNIWRPPRAHHCRVCDNCVETQDHHCVWLNNCVGRRNYRYFFTFVASATLLGTYLAGLSLAQVLVAAHRSPSRSFAAAASAHRMQLGLFGYALLATAYPAALAAYHLFLMARGETTREYLQSHKFAKRDRHRPYQQTSVLRNWSAVLCRPRPPTYLRFKGEALRGDRRFGERRRGGNWGGGAAGGAAGGVEMVSVIGGNRGPGAEAREGAVGAGARDGVEGRNGGREV